MKKILAIVLCCALLVVNFSLAAFAAQAVINESFTYESAAPVSEGALNSNWAITTPPGGFLGSRLYAELTGDKLAVYGVATSYRGYLNRINSVVYTGDYSGMGNSYMIKFNFDKNGDGKASTNDAKVGFGIRFATDLNTNSYYMLNFTGEGDFSENGTGKPAEKSIWTFLKVENASKVTAELRSDEVFETSTATTGDGGVIMSGEVTIYVSGNSIYWTAEGKRYGDIPYSTSGSYTDESPLSGKTIGFTQSNTSSNFVYKGETTTNSKYTLVDDLLVEAYSGNTVTIYDNADSFNSITPYLYGAQCEISARPYQYLKEDTTELTDGYLKVATELYDAPVVRWGGTSTNFINLMDNLTSTLEKRGDSGVAVGPAEFIKASLAINPDVKFIFNIGLSAQTPDETRQFIHFLLDETGEYADLRTSLGIENPVNLYALELGNENYLENRANLTDVTDENGNVTSKSQERYEAAQAYCTLAKSHLDAVRADFPREQFPQVAFYANVTNEPQDYNYIEWNDTVADMLGDYIDGVVYHFYTGGTTWYSPNVYLNMISQRFVSRGKPDPKFLFTEHAMWYNHDMTYTGTSLRASVCEGSFFNVMMYRDDIASANYHNISSSSYTQWNMFRRYGDEYKTTGINKIYKMYTEMFGDKRINFGGTGVTGNTSTVVGVSKRSSDGRIIVSVANANLANAVDLNFNFASGKNYKITRAITVKSDSWYDEDYEIEDKKLNMPHTMLYGFAPGSTTFLTFEEEGVSYPSDVQFKEPEELYVTADTASTDSFVKNGDAGGVIYAEMTPQKENGVYYYPRGTTVRKIVNVGSTTARVYVSGDSYAYKKLADIAAGETFVNRLTADKYYYIKSNEDIKIYSLVNDSYYMPGEEADLSLSRNGSELEAAFASGDNNVAYVNGGKLTALRNGTAAVTAKSGALTVARNATVTLTNKKTFNFASYGSVGNSSRPITTPTGGAIRKADVAGGWKLVQGSSGTVNNNPKLYINNKSGLFLSGASLQPIEQSNIASVLYYGGFEGIGDKYTIDVSGKKAAVNIGIGLKFAVHNSGRNFYMLFLNGNVGSEGYIYNFYKFVNGSVVGEVHGDAENDTQYGGRLSGNFTMKVNVDGNTVSWVITGTRNGGAAFENPTGVFVDDDPFVIDASRTQIGFMSNCNSSGYSNYNNITSVTVSGEEEQRFITDGDNNLYIDTRDFTNGTLIIKASMSGNKLASANVLGYADFSGGKSAKLSLNADEKIYIWKDMKPLYTLNADDLINTNS